MKDETKYLTIIVTTFLCGYIPGWLHFKFLSIIFLVIAFLMPFIYLGKSKK